MYTYNYTDSDHSNKQDKKAIIPTLIGWISKLNYTNYGL